MNATKAWFPDKLRYVCVAQEKHEDGNPHLHALLCLKKKVDIQNQRYFDIGTFHPNMQAAKHIHKVYHYVRKDGDFIEDGEFDPPKRGPKRLPEMDATTTKKEYLEECFYNDVPYGYAIAFYNAFNDTSIYSILTTAPNPLPLDWIKDNFLKTLLYEEDDNRSWVIVGPAGCGKSVWAKANAPKPALWVTHMDTLKCFNPSIKSIIFDDMKFTHLDPTLQIPIVDRYDTRALHCRYAVANIPAGVVKIFTCNERPFTDHPAINRRMKLFEHYDGLSWLIRK